ncbi:hypothetical protein GL325_02700 [Aeromicrobium sp. 636]|uniref:Lipoprotein n=1 Tax=Aeromicrobium senzhongii TaxID=2663859 RepID=A0A8I0ES67_9ACTN|nr:MULTISPECIES: hypothetical protein [Aeromicrobium]MBC9225225.1 hypothetical protein [Aeromicrobium senzhongii]MCQ3997335.1 hypothetical protein [Aeromicrobium sp. 636]MTB87272.1 hypothetical protein [Aeromicrobium senzhongii]QNL95661.1 hypothetical protein H9L21_07080 [Aeromicrobium senzhongii]
MRRPILMLCLVLGLGTVAGCSGGGPYCDAIDEAKEPLTSFGKQTDTAFASYAEVTQDIAEVAPAEVKKEWQAIAKATRRVVVAHRKADFRLQDMKDEVKVNALSKEDIDRITAAHEAFNDTKSQRVTVVENVDAECGIDLSQK